MTHVRHPVNTQYFVEVWDKNHVASKPVPLTASQLRDVMHKIDRANELREEIKELQAELKQYEDDCTHPAQYDERGYMYDTRICAVCNKILGLI